MAYENGSPASPRDFTPGDRDAYPTSTTFSIGDDFTFSPRRQASSISTCGSRKE